MTTPPAPQPPPPGAAVAEPPPRFIPASEYVARWRERQEGA